MELRSRVCVVTGGGSGIGREVALAMSREGARLALCDMNSEKCAAAARECEAAGAPRATAHTVDVSKREQVRRFADEVVAEHGAVHVLVNNAGIAVSGPFDRLSEAEYDKCLAVNLHGVIDCTRAFLPSIIKQDMGCIANVSSICGFWPLVANSPYTVSKYGVRGFSEQLTVEAAKLWPHIKVLCIHPEFISTDLINSSTMINDDRMTVPFQSSEGKDPAVAIQEQKDMANMLGERCGPSAQQAAAWIVTAIKKRRSRVMVGAGAAALDLMVRLWPRVWEREWVGAAAFLVGIPLRRPLLAVLFLVIGARLWRARL